jgi:hypothetical protein
VGLIKQKGNSANANKYPGVYSGVTHYLKAVAAAGADEAKAVLLKCENCPLMIFLPEA